jgi:uncharacterized protein YggE
MSDPEAVHDQRPTCTVPSMNAEVIVRGEGHARSLPDRALVHAVVEADGEARDSAYAAAARLTAAVDEVLAQHVGAIAGASTASIVVQPKTRWRKGESVRTGWRAARTTVLEVVVFDDLGALIAELSASGAAVAGPVWQLDPDNEAHRVARRLAAEDARRRAEDYAAALGVTVRDVAWVAEPGLRATQRAMDWMAGAPMAAGGGVAEDVIEVTPDEIPIHAAIEVGFVLSPA